MAAVQSVSRIKVTQSAHLLCYKPCKHYIDYAHIYPQTLVVLLLVMGNILSVADRFSKSTHFIPLEKLSNAVENAKLLINHVFKLPLLQKECLIGVPNSSLKYGKLSAQHLEPKHVSARVFIHKPMVKQKG